MNANQADTLARNIQARLKAWSGTLPTPGELLNEVGRWQHVMQVGGVKAAAQKAPDATMLNFAGITNRLKRQIGTPQFDPYKIERVASYLQHAVTTHPRLRKAYNSIESLAHIIKEQGELYELKDLQRFERILDFVDQELITEAHASGGKSAKSADAILSAAAALLDQTADALAAKSTFGLGGTVKAMTPGEAGLLHENLGAWAQLAASAAREASSNLNAAAGRFKRIGQQANALLLDVDDPESKAGLRRIVREADRGTIATVDGDRVASRTQANVLAQYIASMRRMKSAKAIDLPLAALQDVVGLLGDAFKPEVVVDAKREARVKALGFGDAVEAAGTSKGYNNIADLLRLAQSQVGQHMSGSAMVSLARGLTRESGAKTELRHAAALARTLAEQVRSDIGRLPQKPVNDPREQQKKLQLIVNDLAEYLRPPIVRGKAAPDVKAMRDEDLASYISSQLIEVTNMLLKYPTPNAARIRQGIAQLVRMATEVPPGFGQYLNTWVVGLKQAAAIADSDQRSEAIDRVLDAMGRVSRPLRQQGKFPPGVQVAKAAPDVKYDPAAEKDFIFMASELRTLLKTWKDRDFVPASGKRALKLAMTLANQLPAQQASYVTPIVRNLPLMIRDAENYEKQEGYPPRASSVQSLAQGLDVLIHLLQTAG